MTKINRPKTLLLFVISSVFLSACSSFISMSRDEPIGENYGKRTTGAFVDDQLIETKATVNLKKSDQRFQSAQVAVNSFNGVVLITGNVAEIDMRAIATKTVSKIRKVRRVNNELNVSPPRANSAKLADAWLSRKVKSRFLFSRDVDSNRVKVVVNDGVIFLMGLVTHAEADNIVEATKKSYGLQKIVRVFEYID
tara:strand:- start:36 stop:620 length:585 start_codon:yes stop_codon:yes gene_type:complete